MNMTVNLPTLHIMPSAWNKRTLQRRPAYVVDDTMEYNHKPVMADECIAGLDINPNGIYIDCTVGGGGHAALIAARLDEGRLIALDRDREAIEAASRRLWAYRDKIIFINSNFSEVKQILGRVRPNGALIDLGVSSYQIDNPERGFSYMKDAPLDMRMDRREALTAYDVVNGYSVDRLTKIIHEYGEERYAARIANRIAAARRKVPLRTTLELASVIESAVPELPRGNYRARYGQAKSYSHPAKRTFQAIRIEVNGELEVIAPAIRDLVDALAPDGRLAVITFHSLEDRIVKQTFAELQKGCTCPPDFPVCICGKVPLIEPVTKKPVTPCREELEDNPRSHSAKLRIVKKI
jgi:16S rRNA (cytosine1402-N4)-methyltransferase